MTDAIHYTSLTLTDVRAFGGTATLNLSRDGRPSRWCVILGENGVGKTTLLRALAAMRPVPAVDGGSPNDTPGDEAAPPDLAAPALTDFQNDRVLSFVRHGEDMSASIEATFASDDGTAFELAYEVLTRDGRLLQTTMRSAAFPLAGRGPLVIGYGASRLRGTAKPEMVVDADPAESLFDDDIRLFDPNEVAEEVDYAALAAGRTEDVEAERWWTALQSRMTDAVAALIPGLDPRDVVLRGRGGIRIRTPSGEMPVAEVSMGVATMVAWVLDLAWRLTSAFPESVNPFEESAIVLIDEVELHLHPMWQRSLRPQLLKHFPRIQFIVTSHAPVMAQESVAAGDPISIVRWDGSKATIAADPFPKTPVRLDEVATELFEMETSLPSRFEDLLQERRDLVRKEDLTEADKRRLIALNEVARAVRDGTVTTDREMEDMMAALPIVNGESTR